MNDRRGVQPPSRSRRQTSTIYARAASRTEEFKRWIDRIDALNAP